MKLIKHKNEPPCLIISYLKPKPSAFPLNINLWNRCIQLFLFNVWLQGEQLEKFEKGMDQINADMKLAEQALRSMDLLCGIFPKFWKKSGGFKEDDAVWGDQKVRESWFIRQSGVRCSEGSRILRSGRWIDISQMQYIPYKVKFQVHSTQCSQRKGEGEQGAFEL